jgi:hypothetical protein
MGFDRAQKFLESGEYLRWVTRSPGHLHNGVLRNSAGDDRRQLIPVGPSRIEEGPDSVVLKVSKPLCRSLDSLYEIVGTFGRAIGHFVFMPGKGLFLPFLEGPRERLDFRWFLQ